MVLKKANEKTSFAFLILQQKLETLALWWVN